MSFVSKRHASLADTLLRHASHSTVPIFIMLVERLALKATKLYNPHLDQNCEALCQVPAVNNVAFMLPFNAQRLGVCEQSIKLNKTGSAGIQGL